MWEFKIKKILKERKMNKKTQGKRNRESGARFELKVRKDLEEKGWIISKWMNNVGFEQHWFCGTEDIFPRIPTEDGYHDSSDFSHHKVGKLIPAKYRFRGPGIPMSIGTGFPDFIAFKQVDLSKNNNHAIFEDKFSIKADRCIIGVEVKSNGYLDKIEKEKCRWLLDNNIFSKILITSKGEKRGEIIYKEFSQ